MRALHLLLFGFLSVFATAVLSAADRPNVVVILTDDQGWGDLSIHGNTNLKTPHIDSLAHDGAIFDRFYVCPVCSPTRAEFLTGRYHSQMGVFGTSLGEERIDTDEHLIAQSFQAAGYKTAALGKWHNGTPWPYHPNARGFEEYYGFTSGHWGHYFSPLLDHNGQLTRGEGYIIDELTDHALDFIEANQDQSFFCYVPFNTPHSPFQVSDEFYGRITPEEITLRNRDPEKEELDKTHCALAMCENIDWNVGRILTKLDQLKLAENTIVVYFTDNGPNTWRWNGGMRGRKGSTDEGGVRVPCLMRWSGHIPAGTKIDSIAGAIDLFPTLAELAGVEPQNEKPFNGVSLAAELLGRQAEPRGRIIFSHWRGKVSARTQTHRLDDQGRLYDMQNDPGQNTDIAKSNPELARQLRSAVADWKEEFVPKNYKDDRPYPVGAGGEKFPLTQLPARDGLLSGNVERSGRAPNCSFFRNWISTEDRIWWDVTVEQAGTYDVSVLYACPAESVGSKFDLLYGETKLLSATITEPHLAPLYGAEADRADRGSESFVRDFKRWDLGRIELEAGRKDLSLKATQIAGGQVMEVRMLLLNRVN